MTRTIYRLPGVRMSVRAKPVPIQRAVEWLFQVCPKTSESADLHLEAIGVAPEQVPGSIPNWIRTELPAIDSDPFMIQGPAGERAAVGRFDGLLFCAWIDLEHTLARLVFAMREEEQPQSTTLSILSLVLFPVLRDVFLRQRGLLLHSAAVKCPNGVGIQFVAESGGGKTTTSLSLVRLGAKLVRMTSWLCRLRETKLPPTACQSR